MLVEVFLPVYTVLMTSLCETCPLRMEHSGEVVGAINLPATLVPTGIGGPPREAVLTFLVDAGHNALGPFEASAPDAHGAFGALVAAIDACPERSMSTVTPVLADTCATLRLAPRGERLARLSSRVVKAAIARYAGAEPAV